MAEIKGDIISTSLSSCDFHGSFASICEKCAEFNFAYAHNLLYDETQFIPKIFGFQSVLPQIFPFSSQQVLRNVGHVI